MRPDVTIRQRAEKGVTERVQTHITIRMRGKAPVMRDVDTAKATSPMPAHRAWCRKGSGVSPTSMGASRAATNTIPFFRVGAGKGSARMNMVSTGATKDSGNMNTCENSRQLAVPKARRRMRRLATGDGPELARASVGIGQVTGDPHS